MAREYLLSTDIAGVVGSPWHLKEISGFALKDPYFKGLEQIAWHSARIQRFFLGLNGFKVVGMHGQLGGAMLTEDHLDKGKVFVVNNVMLQSESHLFSSFSYNGDLNYALLHSPRALDPNVRRLIRTFARDPNFRLFVENHPFRGGLGAAVEAVREIRSDGVQNCDLMFDLVHYIHPYLKTNSYDTMWKRAMEELKGFRNLKDREERKIRIGLHIPIGLNLKDSLFLTAMKDEHWNLLAEALAGLEDVVIVYENQHEKAVVLSKRERIEESKRLVDIIEYQKDKRIIGAKAA